MKNFWTAIRDSIHHSPAIALATLCSVGIAILWSSNIGALYPVIDMTLKGESMQSWFEKSIESSYAHLDQMEAQKQVAERNALVGIRFAGQDLVPKSALRKNIDAQIATENSSIAWKSLGLSWSDALLPRAVRSYRMFRRSCGPSPGRHRTHSFEVHGQCSWTRDR